LQRWRSPGLFHRIQDDKYSKPDFGYGDSLNIDGGLSDFWSLLFDFIGGQNKYERLKNFIELRTQENL